MTPKATSRAWRIPLGALPSRQHVLAFVFFLFCVGLTSTAQAQSCVSTAFSNVAFGNVDVLPGTQIDGAGNLTVTCTGITGANKVLLCFTMNAGTFSTGTTRQMGSGANRLNFDIYKDAARSVVWDATLANAVGVVLTSAVPSVVVPVYARIIASQQTVPPSATAYTTTMTPSGYGSVFTGATPSCATQPFLNTRTFTVSATVVSSCTVTTTTLNFGATTFFTSNLDATNTVSVTCTATTPYHVRLDGGLNGGTPAIPRKMSLGANQVSYDLYRDAARSLYWGGTDSTNTLDATGTASAIGHTVFGRIPPQASQPPGTYTDTVVVVISFL